MTTAKDKINFEESLKKVQTLIEEIEQGKISIDEIVEKFQQGKMLIEQLTKKINQIEEKVSKFENENIKG